MVAKIDPAAAPENTKDPEGQGPKRNEAPRMNQNTSLKILMQVTTARTGIIVPHGVAACLLLDFLGRTRNSAPVLKQKLHSCQVA